MDFLEPLRYVYLLRTGIHALTALGTLVSALLFLKSTTTVVEPPDAHIFVHDGIVIYLEVAGDFHTVWTG